MPVINIPCSQPVCAAYIIEPVLLLQYFGGTNFGRTSGGPFYITSYDYDAPLDEYGGFKLRLTGTQIPKKNIVTYLSNEIMFVLY